MDIWIETEHWAPGEWSTEDDNSDVIVTLDDGSRWSSTFFTFSNVGSLREKYRLSGECLEAISSRALATLTARSRLARKP
jgi:hypothetical protein